MSERKSKKEMIDMMLATGEIGEGEYRRLWQAIENEDDKTYQVSMGAQSQVEGKSKSKVNFVPILLCLGTSSAQIVISIGFVLCNRLLLSVHVGALKQTNASLSFIEAGCVRVYEALQSNVTVAVLIPALLLPALLGYAAVLMRKPRFMALMTLVSTLFSGFLVMLFVVQFFSLYYALALAM
jgi:hypothetical protein